MDVPSVRLDHHRGRDGRHPGGRRLHHRSPPARAVDEGGRHLHRRLRRRWRSSFGLGVWAVSGPRYAGEFFAGWLTEYSLSIDNLFIFVIIMGDDEGAAAPAAVRPDGRHHPGADLPRHLHRARRGGDRPVLLGLLHLRRVPHLHRGQAGHRLPATTTTTATRRPDNAALRFVKKRFPSTDDYRGTKLTVVENGKRLITPMLIVIVALGSTDLLFALDSIPAIYGLTEEPYLVFTANVFALMGLRQLYFLIGGLLQAAGLPVDRPVGHPGLHRRQAGPRGAARLPLGRLGSLRRRDPDLVVADRHHRHPAHHHRGQPDQEPVRRGLRRRKTPPASPWPFDEKTRRRRSRPTRSRPVAGTDQHRSAVRVGGPVLAREPALACSLDRLRHDPGDYRPRLARWHIA